MRKNAQVYTLDTRPPRWEHGVRMMVGSVLPWEVQTISSCDSCRVIKEPLHRSTFIQKSLSVRLVFPFLTLTSLMFELCSSYRKQRWDDVAGRNRFRYKHLDVSRRAKVASLLPISASPVLVLMLL